MRAVSNYYTGQEGYGRYHYSPCGIRITLGLKKSLAYIPRGKENIQFCRQFRGSLCELLDDLNVCIDESYVPEDEYHSYRKDVFHLLKLLNGYIARTKELQRECLIK